MTGAPAPAPPGRLPRPYLVRRLTAAARCRLVLVVAGAGYGKSEALSQWAETTPLVWLTVRERDRGMGGIGRALLNALDRRTPGIASELTPIVAAWSPEVGVAEAAAAFVDLLAGWLHDHRAAEKVIVVDDASELPPDDAAWVVLDALIRQGPDGMSVVIASRTRPPLSVERLRGRGALAELDVESLALNADEVGCLLSGQADAVSESVVERVVELTGGRPAAVRLVAEALAAASPDRHHTLVAALAEPGQALFEYLAAEVVAAESPDAVLLLRCAAALGAVDDTTARALGVTDPEKLLADLARRGVIHEDAPHSGRFVVDPAIGAVVRRASDPADEARLRATTAAAMEASGNPLDALTVLLEAPADEARTEAIRALLRRAGRALATPAGAAVLAAALGQLGAGLETELELLLGEALQISGDWRGALAAYERAAGRDAVLTTGLAWRWGMLLYLKGELSAAQEVLDRAAHTGTDGDQAQVLAWQATVRWSRGNVMGAKELGARALSAAEAAGDLSAIAAARVALALVAASEGDRGRNLQEYTAALAAAEQARDTVQTARIRANLTSKWLEESRYVEAVAEADTALRISAGLPVFSALAECNRAEALLRLGRLEEAKIGLQASRDRYLTFSTLDVQVPTLVLGELLRERGDLAGARAAYEEARALAERSGHAHGHTLSLAGLARVIAAEDPELAQLLAFEAISQADALTLPQAAVAAGWVAHAVGDLAAAGRHALAAERAAQEVSDRAALAEAVELAAVCVGSAAVSRLDEALRLWRDIGNPIGAARAQLARALLGPAPDAAAQVAAARSVLRDHGVREQPAAAGLLAAIAAYAPGVRLTTLGGFRVLCDGNTVPLSAWQSRKARDLLKLLAARQGRPLAREAIGEALWPEDDPDRVSNRLSVALSIVRGVLDPARIRPQDHCVLADKTTVALDVNHVAVDVIELLAASREGLRVATKGDWNAAVPLLRAAEDAYAGDFLEEDVYADWAVECREQARLAALEASRALARWAMERDDDEAASRHLRRVLERDPDDEDAWLGLVGSMLRLRRHGEARRAYATYARRMAELGVTPAPFEPAVNCAGS